jgi:hypothetical protein
LDLIIDWRKRLYYDISVEIESEVTL